MAKNRLRLAIDDFLETSDFGGKIGKFSRDRSEQLEKEIAEDHREIINIIKSSEDLDPTIRNYLERNLSGERPVGVLAVVGMALGAILAIVGNGFTGIGALVGIEVNKLTRHLRLDPTMAVSATFRETARTVNTFQELRDAGWTDERITSLIETLRPRVPEINLILLWRREIITEETLNNELENKGYTPSDIILLKSATELLPSIQELIQLAVRDAFNDSAARRFELDDDFPDEFGMWAERLGMSSDWADRFWRAHWRLPSTNQAFEMFQRLRPGRTGVPFTRQDLETYLKTADISPFFRERLTQIAFVPITRVDIRRFFAVGTINEAEMRERYLDIGVNPDDADLFVDFAKRQARGSERNLTRTAIQQGYKRRIFSFEEAFEQLQQIGFDVDESQFWLRAVDWELEQADIDDEVDLLELRFSNNDINESQLRSELGRLNLPGTSIDFIVEKLVAKQRRRISLPSNSDLEDFYKNDLIDSGELRNQYTMKGWTQFRIENRIKILDIELAEAAAKNAERTRNERQKLEEREKKSEFQLAKANLDVLIADARLAIADLKLAIHSVDDKNEIEDIKKNIDEIKVAIAQLRLDKARISSGFLGA